MRKNHLYTGVSVLALLAMLLPVKSIFARAEEAGSDNGARDSEVEVRTLKQVSSTENRDVEILKREDSDSENKTETGTAKQEDNEQENEADTHRSAVSLFVKSLLEVADKNKNGIGDEVRAVAKEEDEAKDVVAKAVEEIENRSSIKTFLLGTDYKNIGMIRSEIAKTQNRINRLTELLDTMTSSTGAVTTSVQIQNFTEAQTKLADFIKLNEDKFSLFGWFVRLFNK